MAFKLRLDDKRVDHGNSSALRVVGYGKSRVIGSEARLQEQEESQSGPISLRFPVYEAGGLDEEASAKGFALYTFQKPKVWVMGRVALPSFPRLQKPMCPRWRDGFVLRCPFSLSVPPLCFRWGP